MPEATETSEEFLPAPPVDPKYGGLLNKGNPNLVPDLIEPPRETRDMRSDESYRGEAIQLAKSIAAPDWDAKRLVREATLIEMYLRGDESA